MADKKDAKTETDPRDPGRKVPLYQSDRSKEDEVEQSSEDSFPASDPPSYSPVRHTGKTHGKGEKH